MCSASRAWLNRGTPLVPAMLARDTSRHRLRQPTCERASRTRCGPRTRSPMPRRSSLTGSRWPGRRARAGRGRRGRPSVTAASMSGTSSATARRDARRRATGPSPASAPWRTTIPAGSATAGSSSSISRPMTGWRPAASAALTNRTAPYRPLWSVTASPVRPELDRALDQVVGRGRPVEEREVGVAMEFGVRGRCHGSLRSGPADWGPAIIEHLFCLVSAGPGRARTRFPSKIAPDR